MRTIRAHRRVASNPFPFGILNDSSGESDTEGIVVHVIEQQDRSDNTSDEISITTLGNSLSSSSNTMTQSIEVSLMTVKLLIIMFTICMVVSVLATFDTHHTPLSGL